VAAETEVGRSAKRVMEGVQLVVVGLILLGNTTGYVPWSVWLQILMLWPLLLVAIGLDILGRAVGSTALRVAANLVIIAGLVYGAMLGGPRAAELPRLGRPAGGEPISYQLTPRQGVDRASVELHASLTRLTVRPTDGGMWLTATGTTPVGAAQVGEGERDGVVDVDIKNTPDQVRWSVPGPPDARLDVTMDRRVRWEGLHLDGGMVEADVDMTGLDIASFTADGGLSSMRVTFSEVPAAAAADFHGGLCRYELRVPKSLGVELDVDNGLGTVDVQGGWDRVSGNSIFSGVWRSSGYDSAASKLRLVVNGGLSTVRVQRY
jgi:hypothetical protein